LKQTLNKIYRQQAKITPRMQNGEAKALLVMNFYYQGSKQLYQLDNNTITMEELNQKIQDLDALLEKHQVSVSLEEFNVQLLSDFK
jgi:tRNA/tmRNA/rRNA uracil-C5-methylase (TrmA/RlmC/RlmD family)